MHMAKKVMILEEEEFKALEMMQQYIFGIKMDIEFILDNTNTDEMADAEEPFNMDDVREKLIERAADLYKVDTTLMAILNGTFDSNKHQLSKYNLSK